MENRKMAQSQKFGEGVGGPQMAGGPALLTEVGGVDESLEHPVPPEGAETKQLEGAEAATENTTDKLFHLSGSGCTEDSSGKHLTTSLQPHLKGPQKYSQNRRSRSIGEWHRVDTASGLGGVVYLTHQKGSQWSVHGHTHKGRIVLVPEEALFLIECGALEVTCDGKEWSLQEAYQCLLSEIKLQIYQVYASLKRIGFIANRVCLSRQHCGEPLMRCAHLPVLTQSVCPLCDRSSSDVVGERLSDMLEVHKPAGTQLSPYRKSEKKAPDFRVVVARLEDEFPSAEELQCLTSLHPPAPLRVCVVAGSSLAYYTIYSPKT